MEPTVAQTVVRALADAGVRRGYTVPGESFLDLLDAFEAEPALTLVSTRHEGGASFMAEADGKRHGVPAVVMGSRGPGATNLSIGVHTAQQDETPMLVLLGQVPSTGLGKESFQEVDLAAFFRPLAKWSAEARTAREVPVLLAEALTSALSGRAGPAVLAVPSDFWSAPCDVRISLPDIHVPPTEVTSKVATLVDRALSPVVIAGCREREARAELITTAEELGWGVYNAFRRQDAFPEDHPHYAGHLGLSVSADQLQALEQADVVLVLGMRLDEVTSQGYRFPLPEQQFVVVGPGADEVSAPPSTVRVPSAVAPFLRELRSACDARTRDWSFANAAARTLMTPPDTSGTNGMHPTDVVRTLRRLLPDDAVVTNDAGNFSGFLHRYWCFTAPHTQFGPCNGAMGYAVPAAVAAKLAEPERTVVAMVGDGGALMTGQEIETAVRHGAGVIVVVFQNGLYGTIAWHQAKSHGRLSGVAIGAVDFASWARSLGAVGCTVWSAGELEAAVAEALADERPCVLDVHADPDVITAQERLAPLLT